jgi:uncharacterized membrane protein
MKSIVRFLKTTVTGGIVFLLPLVIIISVLTKAHHFVSKLALPISHALPFKSVFGMATADLLANLALVLIAFLAGLLAKTEFGSSISKRVEHFILPKMPGYKLLKRLTEDVQAEDSRGKWPVALANVHDVWLISFIVENHSDQMFTVFVPTSPNTSTGSVYFVAPQQLRPLKISAAAAIQCIKGLGVGSDDLLRQSNLVVNQKG